MIAALALTARRVPNTSWRRLIAALAFLVLVDVAAGLVVSNAILGAKAGAA